MKKYDFYCEEALNGKTPLRIVYESKNVLAFHHTKPAYNFHIVIVPKEHIADLLSLKAEHSDLVLEIVNVAKKIISDNLDLKTCGARLITNLGGFQDSPHLHFHLISGEKTK